MFSQDDKPSHAHLKPLLGLVLLLATLLVYWPVRNFDFVAYDDDRYVTANPHIAGGITAENLAWAFTAAYASTWQPLVWLSYMLDSQIYGVNPSGFHLTNLILHLANVLLLFNILCRMTSRIGSSWFVAALFALHPLHVESVAWVAERKDVLSTLFWMLATGSYVMYAERPGIGRYVASLFFFVLGLMSKPMLVTLPFVLLLLDFWPLRRADVSNGGLGSIVWRLVLEKLPFFFLSLIFSIITYIVQQEGGAVSSLSYLPLSFRLCNVSVSYVKYLWKALWPCHLAVLYPYPRILTLWQVILAFWSVVLLSLLALRGARKAPFLPVGWFWYLGTLVPVIGLVRIGEHAIADRFAYVPLIGIYIIVAWGIPSMLRSPRCQSVALPVLALSTLFCLGGLTSLQLSCWRDSATLFSHAIRVTQGNFVMHNNLGVVLMNQGRWREAEVHLKEAVRIKFDYGMAHYNLGNLMARQGQNEPALMHYRDALRIDSRDVNTLHKMGYALSRLGRDPEAAEYFLKAIELDPQCVDARYNLGVVMERLQQPDQAIASYREAIRINPDLANAHYNLANLLADQGKENDALFHYRAAIRIQPDHAGAHNNLGNLLARLGKNTEAIARYQEALRIQPDFSAAQENLKKLQARQEQTKSPEP